MIYLTSIDLNKNELQNAVVQPLTTAPSNPQLGQIYYNSTDKVMYQYSGTAWKPVGVLYSETSTTGKVLTGLATDGTVSTTKVKDLTLTDYTPTTDGYVSAGDSLGAAIKALDEAVKSAVAGGEINQFAFSNVKIGTITISATGKTDTVEFVAGQYITLTPDASKKTVTIAVNIPEATSSAPGLMPSSAVSKLAGIEAGAQVNVNPDWDSTSGKSQILNKPTKLSQFTNDEGFIDNTVSNLVNYYTTDTTYTKTEVNTLIGNIATISIKVVDSLPSSGSSNIIYLVAKTTADGAQNSYNEYLWTGSKFERIGDTTVDLSNYLTKTGASTNTTVAFTAASNRTLPATGEKVGVIVGKIVKYLSDLETVAFTGSYYDLSDIPQFIMRHDTATLAAGGTTASVTFSGTDFMNATVRDATTGEIVMADVEVSGKTVTVTIAKSHTNALTIDIISAVNLAAGGGIL